MDALGTGVGVGGTGVGVGGGVGIGAGVAGKGVGVGAGVGVGVGVGVGGFGVGLGVRAGVGVGRRVGAGVGVAGAGVGAARLEDAALEGVARSGEAVASGDALGWAVGGTATALGAGFCGSPVAERTPPSIPRGANTRPTAAMSTADAATTPAMRRWRLSELAGWACRRGRSASWPRTGVNGAGWGTGIAGGCACSEPVETMRWVGIVGAGAPATPIR